MALHKSLCFFMFLVTLISCTHARTFKVGGKYGWTTSPSENYNSWAGRLRFLINDTLHFKYDGGVDSVLVVNKGDYDGCNVNNPITKLDGGDSTFKLDRSGPFYFISGNKSNCDQGEKMTVVVLALRNRSPPPGAATPPSPAATPPSSVATPPSSVAKPPSPSTISPVSPSPESPVSPSPISVSPAPSVSPVLSPSGSPTSAPSPFGSPTSAPSGDAPALTPSGSSPGPGGAGAGGPGGAGAGGPGGAPGQSPGSNPADTNSPPPSAASRPFSGSIMASFVTMVFGLWFLN